MSANASLKRAAAEVETARAKYADKNRAKSADQFLDELDRKFKKVEVLHPSPIELFADMVRESGFKNAVPRFREEVIGRRVRDTRLLDTIIAQWGAALCGGKVPALAKVEKPKSGARIASPTSNAIREAEKVLRHARLAEQVREAAMKQVMMDFIMPNGKPLGKCTGTYVARVGGRFTKVGEIAGKAVIETVPAAVKAVGAMERSL